MYLYPKWLRLWHLINALAIIVLIYTGISIKYTGMEKASLLMDLVKAVRWHNTAAIILIASYIIYVICNIFTENGKYYRIEKRNFWSDLGKQLRYSFYGRSKGEKHPFPVTTERKFNPLKKLFYVLTMYVVMPLLILSGLGLFFPEVNINRIFGVSGLILTDILHITMGFFIVAFLIIHIYTSTLGPKPTSLFRGIITGYHEPDDE
jgi:thiosulfate reductase cytochrome b subunit